MTDFQKFILNTHPDPDSLLYDNFDQMCLLAEQYKDVSYEYIGTQTPIERLRNKITPFLTLAAILHRDKNFNVEELVEICYKYRDDIKIHLNDCEQFYKTKNERDIK